MTPPYTHSHRPNKGFNINSKVKATLTKALPANVGDSE